MTAGAFLASPARHAAHRVQLRQRAVPPSAQKRRTAGPRSHFVNAIKGTPLGGHAQLTLPSGDTVRIDRFSAAAAATWFAEISVNALPWRDFLPCALVAIPDAGCDLHTAGPPRAFALAEALASQIGPDAVAVDLLRWVRPMPKAHAADGSRDPQVLYGRLRLRDRMWPIAGHRLVWWMTSSRPAAIFEPPRRF